MSTNKEKYFANKYRIASVRLQNWDYGLNAAYFVTICTQNRECYFGDIVDGQMQLSDIGMFAQKYWNSISQHFQFVKMDAFVVMPNHVHGIIIIDKPNGCNNTVESRHCLVSTDKKTIGQKRFQNQGKHTLSSIIGSYKSIVTKNARKIHADFAWQSRFYDHIIRNHESFEKIKSYIIENPLKWNSDKLSALIDELPTNFTTKTAKDIGTTLGLSGAYIEKVIKKGVDNGMFERVNRGEYKKV